MAPAHPGEGHSTGGECARGCAQSSQRRFVRRRISSGIERFVPLHPKPSIGSFIGAIAMSAVGWMWLRRFVRSALTRENRPRTHSQRRAKTIPGLERLEAMSLLSTGMHLMSAAAAHVDRSNNQAIVSRINQPQVVSTDNMSSAAAREFRPDARDVARADGVARCDPYRLHQ